MTQDAWIDQISETFLRRFPDPAPAWRTIGREAEYPVVHADGTGADIGALWPHLLELGPTQVGREGELITSVDLPGASYTSEVGRGTIEVVLPPADDLHELAALHERAMAPLIAAAEREGVHILGYGIQPVTPGTPAWMTGKRRYQVLLDVLGETWLWFTLTASDQCHVATGRDEVIGVTNLTNLLAPVSLALLANSPVFNGEASGFCSAREATMGRIHAASFRHGMPAGPAADARAWVARSFDLDYLMHKDAIGTITPVHQPFGAWLGAADLQPADAFTAWAWHDHYLWSSTRPRTAHATVELRSPCQQPWDSHLAAAAFGVAAVCGWREIAALLEQTFGAEAWPEMRRWHHAAMAEGLAAPEPAPGLIRRILDLGGEALDRRGRGEAALLAPLYARLDARSNPGQDALRAFEAGGVAGLVAHTAIR